MTDGSSAEPRRGRRWGHRSGRRWGRRIAGILAVPLAAYTAVAVYEYALPFPGPADDNRPASTESHPWLVAIASPEAHPDKPSAKGCVGALVAPHAVVTAAHCVGHRSPAELAVVADRDDLADEDAGTTVGVSAVWAHPDFMGHDPGSVLTGLLRQVETAPADVGLLILEEELRNDPLPIAAADSGSPAGERMELFGYRLSPGDDTLLWRASSTVEDDGTCARRANTARRMVPPQLHGLSYDEDSYMCANDGRTLVRGSDSGSPAVVNGRLAGVAAFNAGADYALPSYFTRISTYADELEKRIDTTSAGSPRPE